MLTAIWRIRPLAVPTWPVPCLRCAAPFLESTGRFRVNSNGRLHDVWLIYRCSRCGERRKRRVERRVAETAVPLEAYRRDDPALAATHAFAVAAGQPFAYAVDRPPLPAAAPLLVTIEQPVFCAVRWDRFLARELGWSRAAVTAAWRSGRIDVEPRCRASQPVRNGQRLAARSLDPLLGSRS